MLRGTIPQVIDVNAAAVGRVDRRKFAILPFDFFELALVAATPVQVGFLVSRLLRNHFIEPTGL